MIRTQSAGGRRPYELIVIGASLGGLDALITVLRALPADFPAALAIVQHRSADTDERLAEILQNVCALPVLEAEDKMGIEPGHVYLAPTDYHLLIEDCRMRTLVPEASRSGILDFGNALPRSEISNIKSSICNHFALSTDEPVNHARPSIDVFFESVAEAYGEKVIGVLLTGSNEDGAQGLAVIKQRGGLTISQDPKTAKARAMPRAAIALNAADYILPLKEIGPFIAEFGMQNKKTASAATLLRNLKSEI